MKGYFVVAFLFIYAVYVIGEHCHTVSDCVATLCDSNSSHIACDRDKCVCDLNGVNEPFGGKGGCSHDDRCMMGTSGPKCADQATCSSIGRCHKHDENYHCLDGECVCLKDSSLPGGGGHGHGR